MTRRPPGRLRWWHSIAVRLLAATLVVVACAVAATVWLTASTTRSVLTEQQGQVLADDTRVYDTLLTYAATHRDWDGVRPVVDELARSTHRRIVVVSGALRADSAGARAPTPTRRSAVVDALAVDSSLARSPRPDRIASAAVGPFMLTSAERARLRPLAAQAVACLDKLRSVQPGSPASVATAATGRPYVVTSVGAEAAQVCLPSGLTTPTATERRAVEQLTRSFDACTARSTRDVYKLGAEVSGTAPLQLVVSGARGVFTDDDTIPNPAGNCLTLARRAQLSPYVAPPAQLYVTDEAGQQITVSRLPGVTVGRLALAGGLVLLVVSVIAVLAAISFARPLRRVTAAAQRMRDGDSSARVRPTALRSGRRGRDEVSRLAETFDDMAAAVQQGEQQRRAMIADISHELRSPITNIRGWLEAIEDGVAAPDAETLGILTAETVQLQHVVDDLRDLALADAGELTLHRSALPVGDLLEQARAAHAAQAAALGVTLAVTPVIEELAVHADPVRLGQALGNLVSNALRYTPAPGTVTLSARPAGREVTLDVADTGVGISVDDLPLVFDRFWRAERSRNRASGGSGLGLPIARRIAQAHGGDVTVRSTPGQGSVFTLHLPVPNPAR